MKKALAYAMLILAIVAGACSSSPDLLIRGRVMDAATGEPIAGARIHEGGYAPKLAAGATTDSTGTFSYFTYPEEHCILVEKEGYASLKSTIGLDPRSREEILDLRLEVKAD